MDSRNKPANMRFLAFSNSTLYHAQNGSDAYKGCGRYGLNECHRECAGRYYSALGARLVAGNEAAGEIGEIGFEWCGPRGPTVSSTGSDELEHWETEITRIRYDGDSEGKIIWIQYKEDHYGRNKAVINRPQIGAFQLLQDIRDAHHAIDYNPADRTNSNSLDTPAPVPAPDPKYGYCQYYPPTATQDATGPLLYKFDEQDAAIHFSCPVTCFNACDASLPSFCATELKQELLDTPKTNELGPHRPPHQQVGPLYAWETQRGNIWHTRAPRVCSRLDVIVTTDQQIKHIFWYGGHVKTGIPPRKSVVGNGRKKERERAEVEAHAKALLELGLDRRPGTGTVVVLCGSNGCLVATIAPAAKKGKITCIGKDEVVTFSWLPPTYDQIFARSGKSYHAWKLQTMFTGALTYAMAKGNNAFHAAKKAAVAMTFMLELGHWGCKDAYDPEHNSIPHAQWEQVRKCRDDLAARHLQPQYVDGKEFWNQSTLSERLERPSRRSTSPKMRRTCSPFFASTVRGGRKALCDLTAAGGAS